MNGFGIDGLCKIMTRPLSNEVPIARVRDVVFWVYSTDSGININQLDNNYTADMEPVSKPFYNLTDPDDRDGNSAARGWMWLCCGMALGWLQTTDNSRGMFGRAVPLEFVSVLRKKNLRLYCCFKILP